MFRTELRKERQKFSAAHFILFDDGTVERLHGHNYYVTIDLKSNSLTNGMMIPFHLVKAEVDALCRKWDECVLIPTTAPAVTLSVSGKQQNVRVKTSIVDKEYSLPTEDCVLVDCDNITCENLSKMFAERCVKRPFLSLFRVY